MGLEANVVSDCREAKDKKLRIWKNFEPSAAGINESERHYSAKVNYFLKVVTPHSVSFLYQVVEINNADSITVKMTSGELRKLFIAGVRPPK